MKQSNEYGMLCPPCQIWVGCFVHPNKFWWDVLSTLTNFGGMFCSPGQKMPGMFCPWDVLSGSLPGQHHVFGFCCIRVSA